MDIYSLGIMFFEMCHAPMCTTSERVKVLAALRSLQICLPSDFTEREHKQQVHLIRYVPWVSLAAPSISSMSCVYCKLLYVCRRWLLNHDPGARPSARELLRAECLPGLQLEETQQQEVLRQALTRPASKAYQHIIAACLEQVSVLFHTLPHLYKVIYCTLLILYFYCRR